MEVQLVELHEPQGWVRVPLRNPHVEPPGLLVGGDAAAGGGGGSSPGLLRAHLIQVCILAMHQNGRDTHVRQVCIRVGRVLCCLWLCVVDGWLGLGSGVCALASGGPPLPPPTNHHHPLAASQHHHLLLTRKSNQPHNKNTTPTTTTTTTQAKVYGPRLSLAPMAAYARGPGQGAASAAAGGATGGAAGAGAASSYTVPDFTSVEFSQFSTVR